MQIRFYAPFNMLIGQDVIQLRLEAEGPVRVRTVIERLVARYPVLAPLCSTTEGTDRLQKATILFAGRIVGLEDQVEADGDMKILGPISGG